MRFSFSFGDPNIISLDSQFQAEEAEVDLTANIGNVYRHSCKSILKTIFDIFGVESIMIGPPGETEAYALENLKDYVYDVQIISGNCAGQTLMKIPRMSNNGYFVIGGKKKSPVTLEMPIYEDVTVTNSIDKDIRDQLILAKLRFPGHRAVTSVYTSRSQSFLRVRMIKPGRSGEYESVDFIDLLYSILSADLGDEAYCYIRHLFESVAERAVADLVLDDFSPKYVADWEERISESFDKTWENIMTLCYMAHLCIFHTLKPVPIIERDDYYQKSFRSAGETIRTIVGGILNNFRGKDLQTGHILDITKLVTERLFATFRTGTMRVLHKNYDKMVLMVSERSSIDVVSSIRRVVVPTDEENPSKPLRQVHPTQTGYVCVVDTPEGNNVGIIKQLSINCRISIETDIDLPFTRVSDYIQGENVWIPKTIILVNGVCRFVSASEPREILKQLFPMKFENKDISLYWIYDRFVSIRTSGSRCMRKAKIGSRTIYIAPREYIPDLKESMCISDMLGFSASLIPFIEHNQSSRNVFSSSTIKQGAELNPAAHLQCAGEFVVASQRVDNPLVNTDLGEAIYLKGETSGPVLENMKPNGRNVLVAIMSYYGHNLEDAIILNGESVKNGLFATYRHITKLIDIEKIFDGQVEKVIKISDKFESKYVAIKAPPERETQVLYSLKNETFESVTEWIREQATRPLGIGHWDGSQPGELWARGAKGSVLEIRCRKKKDIRIGDKLTSRHGQKGVVGRILEKEQMPFAEDGRVPDMIIGPHGIAGRQTLGQILESTVSTYCYERNLTFNSTTKRFSDGTPLSEDIKEPLVKMYNGITKRAIEKPIHMGYVYYMPLVHQADEKDHERDIGPRSAATKQPLSGRSQEGGLRFGEMEFDLVLSHGADALLPEIVRNSDSFKFEMCVCGQIWNGSDVCACGKREWRSGEYSFSLKVLMDSLNTINTKLEFF